MNCCCLVVQSCPILCNPMDCSLSGSSFHGIFQARILERVANSFSRGSPWLRDRNQVIPDYPFSRFSKETEWKKHNLKLISFYGHYSSNRNLSFLFFLKIVFLFESSRCKEINRVFFFFFFNRVTCSFFSRDQQQFPHLFSGDCATWE